MRDNRAMSDSPDELEQAFNAPVTGVEVGAWLIDAIAQVGSNNGQANEQTEAALRRIGSLGNPELSLAIAVQVAAMMLIELRFQAASKSSPAEADEMLRRAVLSAHSVSRGDGPRNPFLPASEG